MAGAYFIGIIVFLASLLVSWVFKSKARKYSESSLSNGLSGREIAEKMLRDNGIYDVKVISTPGDLSDHYNPANKTVNLSDQVYHGRSILAAAVAAHECGHAVQHATAYSFLEFRSRMVKPVMIASQFMNWIILIGIFTINTFPALLGIGVALFALTTLFSFITLPVEFDASARAMAWLNKTGMVRREENAGAKDALKWAAMTYVVAALGSLATLLYYLSILNGRRE